MMTNKNKFKYSALSVAIISSLHHFQALAQQAQTPDTATNEALEVIEITATRRTGSIQETPLNISALDEDTFKQQNITELADIARWVPGLSVADQGGRTSSPIIVRGLNTNASGPESDGGTVAAYFGEIPLAVDVELNDIQRVEVLIGPQGTLYGAGTLGGAIRYIPNQVELDETTGEIFGALSKNAESESFGGEAGFVFNTPLLDDVLGFRTSLKFERDPGFIDQPFIIRTPGVSLPDPDWSNPQAIAANLKREDDTSGEDLLAYRAALRWTPTDWLDSTLTYFYQKREAEGRPIVQYKALASQHPLNALIGKFDSAYRYEEPYDTENQLLSLELSADLGFAELVSATGYGKTEEVGNRDHTDLLIHLNYGYEEFPAFTIFTREVTDSEDLTQELRLVSQGDSALSWITGIYYSRTETDTVSFEFAPGYAAYANINRPDDLEYLSDGDDKIEESAFFGEINYAFNDKLDITLGARLYRYDIQASAAFVTPLVNPDFDQANPLTIPASRYTPTRAKDNGSLYKFNIGYAITPDVLTYFTASEGFRLGGSNSIAACPDPLPTTQQLCGLPNELLFKPDTTTNLELGLKSTWLKNKLHFNAAVFNVDWDGAQVASVTVNGSLPITTNATDANSRGFEFSTRAIVSDELSTYATYAYAKAELTNDAPNLYPAPAAASAFQTQYYDGKSGDRLPGAPEHQISFGLNYSTEIFDQYQLDVNYGLTYQSDYISSVGLRNNGETIPGYSVSNFSAVMASEQWSVTFFIDNLFDKYAATSVRANRSAIGQASVAQGNSNRFDIQRAYGHYLLTPRTIGLRFSYRFEDL